MNEFIELTVDGEKRLFNTHTIFEIEPEKSRCRVYQTIYASELADFTNVIVDESYEQVKAMLAGDTIVGDKITDDDVKKMSGDFREMCNKNQCINCKYRTLQNKFICEYAFAKDWLNEKLKGEHR